MHEYANFIFCILNTDYVQKLSRSIFNNIRLTMLVFEYELLLIQLIGTTVSVAMETMNICIIHLHFSRVYGFFLSFLH